MLSLKFYPFPNLITERLILREIGKKDAPTLFKQRSDPRIMQFLDRHPMKIPAEANHFIDAILKDQREGNAILWAICLKENRQQMIGNICFWRIEKPHHRAEIGYILNPDQWGKGIMDEALKAALLFGFNEMKLHSVEAQINPGNLLSEKLLQKNGFVKEAHFKENYCFNGLFLDSVVYSLLTPLRNKLEILAP